MSSTEQHIDDVPEVLRALRSARPVVNNAAHEPGLSPWSLENRQRILNRVDDAIGTTTELITDPRNAPSDFERDNMFNVLNDPRRFDNFSAQLLRLICKADDRNRERLRLGFPRHVEAVERFKGVRE